MCISLHMWYTVSAGSGTPACGPGNRLDNPNFTAKTLFLYDILKRGKKDQLKKKKKIMMTITIIIIKKHGILGTPGG